MTDRTLQEAMGMTDDEVKALRERVTRLRQRAARRAELARSADEVQR